MIDVITWENAHTFGDVLPAMLRMRHRIFVERQGYAVPTYRGMEWDQFDTPAAVYLCRRDETGQPQGCVRLLPTTLPYMIKELWPELVENGQLPEDEKVWEWTRFGVDHQIQNLHRLRIVGELLCGCIEFGLQRGISSYLYVTPLHVATNLYKRLGIESQILGQEKSLGTFKVVAGRIPVLETVVANLRNRYSITGCMLRPNNCAALSLENQSSLPVQLLAA